MLSTAWLDMIRISIVHNNQGMKCRGPEEWDVGVLLQCLCERLVWGRQGYVNLVVQEEDE